MLKTFIKKTLPKLKTHIEFHPKILGNLNTELSLIDRTLRKKLKRDKVKLVEDKNQMNLTDIYRTFHPKTRRA